MTAITRRSVEKRGDANRLGFALQLTTVRFVGTFLDDPTAVPPAVLATMSRQLGIDTTTDLTGYRDGKWRFAHAAQIRTEHGYRDLADRADGHSVRPEDEARLSPLGHEHINLLGRYSFAVPESVARGELRPLRNPADGGR